MQFGTTLLEGNLLIAKESTLHLLFDPVILLWGICPERIYPITWKYICTRLLVTTLFVTAKYWKWPKCPHKGQCWNKLWHIHTKAYYAAVKKVGRSLKWYGVTSKTYCQMKDMKCKRISIYFMLNERYEVQKNIYSLLYFM